MRLPCPAQATAVVRAGRRLPGLEPGEVAEQGGEIHGLHEMVIERGRGRQAFLAVAGDGDEPARRQLRDGIEAPPPLRPRSCRAA